MKHIRSEYNGPANVDGEMAQIPLTGGGQTPLLSEIDLQVKIRNPNITQSDRNVLSDALRQVYMNRFDAKEQAGKEVLIQPS